MVLAEEHHLLLGKHAVAGREVQAGHKLWFFSDFSIVALSYGRVSDID